MTPRLKKAKLSHEHSDSPTSSHNSSTNSSQRESGSTWEPSRNVFKLQPVEKRCHLSADRLIREKLLPEGLKCRLSIRVQDRVWWHHQFFDLFWQNIQQYHSVWGAVKQFKEQKENGNVKFVFKSRRVCLRRLREDNDSHSNNDLSEEVGSVNVIDQREWNEALPKLVATKLLEQPKSVFFLEDFWEYEEFAVCSGPGVNSVTQVKQQLQAKQFVNWKGEDFLPQKVLDAIFTKEVIRQLIQQDTELQSDLEWKTACELHANHAENFTDQIYMFGIHLLAITIYVHLNMLFLYRLMDNSEGKGKQDKHIPNLKEKDFPTGFDRSLTNFFKRCQGSFSPMVFPLLEAESKHMVADTGVVVPVMFDKCNDLIDKGGFGEVFRVRIHPDHHDLSENRNELFALKAFSKGDESIEHSHTEQTVLDTLSQVPHDSINPYLASWTQGRDFFMLFPLANSNLGSFLKQQPGRPKLTNERVGWLLDQLFNLIDAVENIHLLGPARLGVNDDGAESDDGQGTRTGWHHDLKPENILVFNGNVLKISDFGTAKIHRVLAGHRRKSYRTHSLTHGDSEYGAPDYVVPSKRGVGRAYDIWSLGCIFLEIMLWLFDGDNAVEAFRTLRQEAPENPRVKTPAFWYHNRATRKVGRKQVVKDKLAFLERETLSKGIFLQLVKLIRNMLEIKSRYRYTAQEVRSYIKALRSEANHNFRKCEDYYAQERPCPGPQLYAPSFVDDRQPRRYGSPTTLNMSYVHSAPADANYLSPITLALPDTVSKKARHGKTPVEETTKLEAQDQLVAFADSANPPVTYDSMDLSSTAKKRHRRLISDVPSITIDPSQIHDHEVTATENEADWQVIVSEDEILPGEDDIQRPPEAALRREEPIPTKKELVAASLAGGSRKRRLVRSIQPSESGFSHDDADNEG